MRVMRAVLVLFLVASLALVSRAQEYEEDKKEEDAEGMSWWSNFKLRLKSMVSKWREDLKEMWDQVLAKASDMRTWTVDMFENFKVKLREWLETKPDVPEEEKNEIESFISKLKLPTEKPREFDP